MKEKQLELDIADEIMKERNKRGLGGGVGSRKVSQVLQKSREICLDNYMITQLRQKRTELLKRLLKEAKNNMKKIIELLLIL